MATRELVLMDVGLGNIRSVERALLAAADQAGITLALDRTGDPERIRRAERIVFPGQGGFAHAAEALASDAGNALRDRLLSGVPFFGICLGLQLLFERSEEAPGATGLGLLHGTVKRLDAGPEQLKIPHMGWNQLELTEAGNQDPHLAAAGGAGTWVYFVHSFHAVPENPAVRTATASYGPNEVTAAIRHENLFATQFHPEKSQGAGLKLLASFLAT